MQERVQKILSQAGIASRRKSEDLITQGLVKVNGRVIELGAKADSEIDKITVKGKLIQIEKKVYLMLNKPQGFLSTVTDDRQRKTIMDIIKRKEKLFPVGRLDRDAEGLLLITNDGDWANSITHPSFEVTKTYQVKVSSSFVNKHLEQLRKGITIENRKVVPEKVTKDHGVITITIHEGRKHIIKRMFEELGYQVSHLKRIQIGSLTLDDLKKGSYRELTQKEIKELSPSTSFLSP